MKPEPLKPELRVIMPIRVANMDECNASLAADTQVDSLGNRNNSFMQGMDAWIESQQTDTPEASFVHRILSFFPTDTFPL